MQKLSYRDRIILLVISIIAVIAVGVMLFIKPKMAEIESVEASLQSKQAEWDELEAKINQIDSIKERIQTKYTESVDLGNRFIGIQRAYTLDKFIQDYINRNAMFVKGSISFTEPSVVTLSPYMLSENTIEYELGESANLNVTENEEEGEQSADSSEAVGDQSLPCGTVSFGYTATRASLMQFMQEIKDSGKTMEIKSVSMSEYTALPDAVISGNISLDVFYADMISNLDIAAEIDSVENPEAAQETQAAETNVSPEGAQ